MSKRPWLAAFVFCVMALPAIAQSASQEALQVWVLAGQSNMEGYTSSKWIRKNAPALVAERDDVWCAWRTKWGPLKPGLGHEVGPELGFGHLIGDASESPVLLCKTSVGGTNLHVDWRSPRARKRAGGKVGYLYRRLIREMKRVVSEAGERYPAAAGRPVQIRGFVWLQGESDCFRGLEKHYEANLRDLFADVREAVGNPELPVCIVEINDSPTWDKVGGGGPVVRAAERKVAAESEHTVIFSTSDLNEGFHYKDGDHLTIGRRAGEAMLPFAQRKVAAKDSLPSLRKAWAGLRRCPPRRAPQIPLDTRRWKKATAGWGGLPKIGKSIQGRPLTIDGERFAKGIGTHARSEIVYALEGNEAGFVATVGLDDEAMDRGGAAVFEIDIDGKRLAASPLMRSFETWNFDLKLPEGCREIVLRVRAAGKNRSDHANWVNAGFLRRLR